MLIEAWTRPPEIVRVRYPEAAAREPAAASPEAAPRGAGRAPETAAPILPRIAAGRGLYARTLYEVNSDYPGPVLLELTSTPGVRDACIRLCTASTTCSATVRPKRAIHACGIGSVFVIVPVAVASPSFAVAAGTGLESVNVIVSEPSSWLSSSTSTETVFPVSPALKLSVPESAV